MKKSILFFIPFEVIYLAGLLRVIYLNLIHQLPIIFIPQLQRDPLDFFQLVSVMVIPLAICFYLQWLIIEES